MESLTLTREQAEALYRGESVTIKLSDFDKAEKWEPKGGDWFLSNSGAVFHGLSAPAYKEFGVERQTEKEAEKASRIMRSHNRLLAYVAEFGGDWEADWSDYDQEKCYVDLDKAEGRYEVDNTYKYKSLGTVYMSEGCAKGLCRKLNKGEVEL